MKSIRQCDSSLQPREKALQLGIDSLNDSELLSLLLGCGTRNKPLQQLSMEILQDCGGLAGLSRMSIVQMMSIKGLGMAKACEIAACREIMNRINYQDILKRNVIESPDSLIQYLKKSLGSLDNECFMAVFIDNKCRIINSQQLFKGGQSSVAVETKSVFQKAIELKAFGIIAAHNHPSQYVEPSDKDYQMTKELMKAGELLSIPLMDHLIVGYDNYFSFRESGLISCK